MKNMAIALMLLGSTMMFAPAFAEHHENAGKDTIKACASGDHACCKGGCCCCKGDSK